MWDRTPYKFGPCAAKTKAGKPCELGRREDSPYCNIHHEQQPTGARWLAGRTEEEWKQLRVEMAGKWAATWGSPGSPYSGDRRVRCLFCYVPLGVEKYQWLRCHHVYYDRVPDEGPGDLISLCPLCHEEVHELQWKHEREYGWSEEVALMAATRDVMYMGWGASQQQGMILRKARAQGRIRHSPGWSERWNRRIWPRDGFIRSCRVPLPPLIGLVAAGRITSEDAVRLTILRERLRALAA